MGSTRKLAEIYTLMLYILVVGSFFQYMLSRRFGSQDIAKIIELYSSCTESISSNVKYMIFVVEHSRL